MNNINKQARINAAGKFLPMAITPNFATVPQLFKPLKRWLCWQLQPKRQGEKKDRKVPMTLKEGKLIEASVTDPSNWLTFDEAINCYQRGLCTGIGFAFTNTAPKICFVDVDNCIDEDGTLNAEAQAAIELCQNSFVEKSQSGRGIHIFFIDEDFPGEHGRKKGNVEVYAFSRYVAITGVRIQSSADDILTVNGACRAVIAKFIDADIDADNVGNLFDKTARQTVNKNFENVKSANNVPMSDDDRRLVEYFRSDKCRDRDPNMFNLFNGHTADYFKHTGKTFDDSVADNALMTKIFYYIGDTGTDKEIGQRALKIFDQSELAKRDKWNREDYQLRTLTAAFDFWNKSGRKTSKFSSNDHTNTPRLSDEQRANLFGNTSHTDRANAKRLAYLFGDRLRYLQDVDKWLTYDGGIWTKAANARNGAIMPFIDRTAELLKANADTDAEHKVAACFENARKAAPAITFLKGIESIIVKQADLDNHPYLFNCLNGVVNLQDGKLYPADPSLLLTRQAAAEFKGIDYRDPDNLAEKFLQDIMPNDETREGLLRFLGYALSGVIREQVAQFWRGDGANGKSTLINLLMEVLNTYATKIPNAAILASNKPADADRATTALNSLDGARLAIFDELPQNARLNTALFKTLAGGDKITIRRLHEEGVTIKPTAKIILSGNFNPQLDNTGDFGCSRKIRNLPFNETFTGDRADDRLLEKLLTADARAALLALLVDAARRWHKDGLTESAQMKAAKTDYLAENNFLEEFISENCEFGGGFIELKIFVRKLRDAYEDETSNISDRNLKDMLKRRLDGKDGVTYGRNPDKSRRAGFIGIRWNDNANYDFGGTPINPQDVPDFSR